MARFHLVANSRIVFAPSVAGTSPTRSEINAGTVLLEPGSTANEQITQGGLSGWETGTNFIDVADGSSIFPKTIPGTKSVGSPTMEFYADQTARPKRTALAEGTSGFMLFMYEGDVEGRTVEKYPVTVGSNVSLPNLGNEPHKFRVSFAITDTPVDGILPAL